MVCMQNYLVLDCRLATNPTCIIVTLECSGSQTVAKIREDSGFAENSNIADEVFSSYQEEAYAHIISIVASRYTIQGGISTLVDADP